MGHWQANFPKWTVSYQQQFFQFFPRLLDSLGISRINHVDQGISIGEVVAPVLPQGLLSSDIPDVEFEAVVGQVLDVESLGGSDGGDVLIYATATSLESDFRMVVLPALSRPRTRMRSYYFLFLRRLRRIPIRPPA